MECKQNPETITMFVDGELEAAARAEFESHLEGCVGCSARVTAERRLAQSFATLPPVTPPGDFEARFWARIAREADPRPAGFAARVTRWLTLPRALVLGAVTAFALVLFVAVPQESLVTPKKIDPVVRIVTTTQTDFELLQDPDVDTISDVDVLEDWDDAPPS